VYPLLLLLLLPLPLLLLLLPAAALWVLAVASARVAVTTRCGVASTRACTAALLPASQAHREAASSTTASTQAWSGVARGMAACADQMIWGVGGVEMCRVEMNVVYLTR
jgi:hypothetical protein